MISRTRFRPIRERGENQKTNRCGFARCHIIFSLFSHTLKIVNFFDKIVRKTFTNDQPNFLKALGDIRLEKAEYLLKCFPFS